MILQGNPKVQQDANHTKLGKMGKKMDYHLAN